MIIVIILLFFNSFTKNYILNNEPIDIVMPCHKKDIETLDICIEALKKNVKNYRRIIVVSEEKFTNNAEWFSEYNYPFNKRLISNQIFKDDIKTDEYLNNPKNRAGWIMKQIFNLYHFRIIPNLSSNILVIDCDTILLKPIEFINEKNGAIFTLSSEYYKPYFEHGKRLIPGFKKVLKKYSGISHHMLFQKNVMEDLLNTIEGHHNLDAWKAICNVIDINEIWGSPLAEYELYFNFAIKNSKQFSTRFLKWTNSDQINLESFLINDYDFVSFHYFLRNKEWWIFK